MSLQTLRASLDSARHRLDRRLESQKCADCHHKVREAKLLYLFRAREGQMRRYQLLVSRAWKKYSVSMDIEWTSRSLFWEGPSRKSVN